MSRRLKREGGRASASRKGISVLALSGARSGSADPPTRFGLKWSKARAILVSPGVFGLVCAPKAAEAFINLSPQRIIQQEVVRLSPASSRPTMDHPQGFGCHVPRLDAKCRGRADPVVFRHSDGLYSVLRGISWELSEMSGVLLPCRWQTPGNRRGRSAKEGAWHHRQNQPERSPGA